MDEPIVTISPAWSHMSGGPADPLGHFLRYADGATPALLLNTRLK